MLRVSEEAARLFGDDEYQQYLFLHGLGVEMAEALAEYWHRRIREELGFADEDGPTLTGLFRQQYRGGRYSWGYPACPDLEDNAKVVELLGRRPHRGRGERRVPAPPRADDHGHHLPPPPGQVLRGLRIGRATRRRGRDPARSPPPGPAESTAGAARCRGSWTNSNQAGPSLPVHGVLLAVASDRGEAADGVEPTVRSGKAHRRCCATQDRLLHTSQVMSR